MLDVPAQADNGNEKPTVSLAQTDVRFNVLCFNACGDELQECHRIAHESAPEEKDSSSPYSLQSLLQRCKDLYESCTRAC